MKILSKAFLGIILVLPVSMLASDRHEWQQVTKVFDGDTINISIPLDAVDISDTPAAAALAAALPTGGEFLGMFFNDAKGYSTWFVGIRRSQGKITTPDYFNGLREYCRANYVEFLKSPDFKSRLATAEASFDKKLSQVTDKHVDYSSQILILGIFDESPRHFSALTLRRTVLKIGVISENELSAGTLTYLYINGKVVTLNLAAKYSGKDSYESVKELTRAAVKSHLENNR